MKVYGFIFLSLFVMPSCGAMNQAERGVESAMREVEAAGLVDLMQKLSNELSALEVRCEHLEKKARKQEKFNQRNFGLMQNRLRPDQVGVCEFNAGDRDAHGVVESVCGD